MAIKRLGRVALAVVVVVGTMVAGHQISFAQDPRGGQGSRCTPGELISHRSRQSKSFLHEDCTYTTKFGANLHYEVEPGRWEEVDLGFRRDGETNVADRNSTVVRVAGARLEVTDRDTGRGIIWVLPARPAVSGHRAGFTWRGLQWDYAVTDLGVKLQANVTTPRGPQTYQFPYQLIGVGDALVVDERGDLRGDGFSVPRAFALGADGETYEAGPWQLLQGRRAAFDFDDSMLPRDAFPYVLDPTTSFNPTAAGDEGNVSKSGFPYPPSSCTGWSDSGSTIGPERSSNAKPDLFWTTSGFMSWDTSSLPDNATITSSTLKFYSRSKSDHNGRSLTADWYSAWPIDCSDFSDSAQTSAIGGIPLANIRTPDADTIATLSGAAGGVSRTGRTGLRTHISGGQPTGPNSLEIWQLGNASNMASPQLNVDYSLPGGPPAIVSATDSPDPVVAGQATTFTVAWSDSDPGDSVRALICKTNAVTSGSCSGGAWASGGLSTTSPSSASYATSTADIGTKSYYAFACDQSNACSGSLSGTFTVTAPNSAPTITSAADSPDPVTAGNAINFTVGWTDSNAGDKVSAVICRTNAVVSGSCSGGTWASSGLFPTSPASASATTSSADAGTNTYYAFACDQSNACSSSHSGTFQVVVPNSAPSISSAADSPDPVTAGNAVQFNLGWSDPNSGDTVRALICKTNGVASGACLGGEWAKGAGSSTSPATASYITSSSDIGTNSYYAFVCDQSSACSTSLSGTFSVTAANAAPNITSASDAPDPVTAGNALNFSVGWSDANSGDAIRAVICRTNAISSSGLCPGGAWVTGLASSTSPASASFTTSLADVGTHSYYAFACDPSNVCSSSLTGTFTITRPNAAPQIASVWDTPDPIAVGGTITFNVSWSDPGDSVTTIICRTNAVTSGSCPGGSWAIGPFSSTSPSSVSYRTTQSDVGTRTYYAFVCDSQGSCSSSVSGTFTVQNNRPVITSASDTPDPIRSGSPITFVVGWADPGDSVRAVVCKTDFIFAGTCPGGTWGVGGFSSTSPATASYTTSSSDSDAEPYWAFACDAASICSPALTGTFAVHHRVPPRAIEDGGDSGSHDIDSEGSVQDTGAMGTAVTMSLSTPFLDMHCAADQNDTTVTSHIIVPVLAYDSALGVQIEDAERKIRQEMRAADRAIAEAHETFKQHMRLQCETASSGGWSRLYVMDQPVPRYIGEDSDDADVNDDEFLDCNETLSWLRQEEPFFMDSPERRHNWFLDSGLAGNDCSAGDSLALTDTTPGLENPNNTKAGWSSLDFNNWQRDGVSANSTPVLLQELFHSLGLTSPESPGYCCDQHTRDFPDFMGRHYCDPHRSPNCRSENDPQLQSIRITCTVPDRVTIDASYTDCGRDTYWDPSPERAEWLCDHYNIATDSLYFHQRAVRVVECL